MSSSPTPPALADLASALDQVGIVVADLDAVEAGMRLVFGVEPTSRSENHYPDATHRGRATDTRVGALFYHLFGLELEFLSPRGGDDIWQEFLDERGPGLHHVRFAVDDHAAVVDALAQRGIAVRQEGSSVRGNGVRYAYFDTTAALGFFVETLSSPAASRPAT
ncbi:MAG: hypothetical protein CMH36_00870 [Microbacterium sp.]|jgi:methylmalonyl-CoA/ethylmalonyl-CoA epimerase|uniref:VOC domain-containing protein n=1 Tax=Microbacterium ginsengisoli TaxID=400772 RepID=A0A3C1KFH1_9MICO|nr:MULTISPECIES: VOC family protein [unclassified Microbacterium]MAL05406.1 hypothetical protein [Microbacterium sp.]MBN9199058.1 VOC family protein [Microbacterium ginsengisoli]MCK9913114.1 VOC family protein [Microbacteriaceae bacterium K1510]KQS01100.1 hypothetical protein ASF93_11505 [Microbacterium sp. Leaf347]KQS05773.1 hypothetical protein ASG00_08425 [Microbacterium sp. Leaf351]